MNIGELARISGTKAETVHYYERIGLLAPPPRTGGNYRSYGAAEAERGSASSGVRATWGFPWPTCARCSTSRMTRGDRARKLTRLRASTSRM